MMWMPIVSLGAAQDDPTIAVNRKRFAKVG